MSGVKWAIGVLMQDAVPPQVRTVYMALAERQLWERAGAAADPATHRVWVIFRRSDLGNHYTLTLYPTVVWRRVALRSIAPPA